MLWRLLGNLGDAHPTLHPSPRFIGIPARNITRSLSEAALSWLRQPWEQRRTMDVDVNREPPTGGVIAAGDPMGSGVVDGTAKTLGLKLKVRGARWRHKNARSTAAPIGCRLADQSDLFCKRPASITNFPVYALSQ